MPTVTVLIISALAVAIGAMVQSAVGLGLGLIATPVVTLLDPALMPGSMLVAGGLLSVLMLARDARHADWGGISWALGGRLAGTLVGAWVVTILSARELGFLVAAVVVAAVVLTSVQGLVPRNRGTLVAAGAVSGATATSVAIGGPPMALMYQRESGPRVRGSLSAYFCAGAVMSLTALRVSGHLPVTDIRTGLLLVAAAGGGFLAAPWLRRYVDAGRTRVAVLILVIAAAIALVVRSVLG